MRLLVFADLHLDATFAWAGREGAQRRRQAIRDTLGNIARLADEVEPDAVLCAGDLYEQERFTPDTGAFLKSTLERLERPIYISPGNHDYLARDSLYAQIDWSPNVHLFRREAFEPVELTEGVVLWGFAHQRPADTPPPFAAGFAVDAAAGDLHLGLFHGSERASFELEVADKAQHAPFDAAEIQASGLAHAFVGHYHRPKAGDWHTYPGNPQPLTFGESGERGAVVVEIASDGSLERTWRTVAASPAHDLAIDVSGAESLQDIRDRVAASLEGLSGVARLALEGEVAPGVELDRQSLERLGEIDNDLDAPPLIDASGVHPAYDIEALKHEKTVRGQFVSDVLASDAFESDAERRRVLVTGLRALDGRDDLEVSW
ncbi:MAG: metallophosphoesterase [Thermoanaerobaculia bacterium]|nr:metallophosphoesterase [Thermoanaerobaculia bacterium]